MVACSVLVAAGCNRGPAEAKPAGQGAPPREVTLVAATAESIPDVLLVYGSLAANDEVTLSFRNAGRLQTLDLDVGSRVKKGEVAAALDPTDFELGVREAEAAVRQARVQLGLPSDGESDDVDPETTASVRSARAVYDEAKLTRDRAADLVDRKLRPPADLDAANAEFAVAESRLQQALDEVRALQATLAQRRIALAIARRALSEAVLRAPFDGEVLERRRRPPEYVAAGETVLRLLDVETLRLRLRVPERAALHVELDQDVVFTVDGVDGEFHGRVKRKSPSIEASNRTLLVEVEVGNAEHRLRPGLFARARIEVSAPTSRVLVPQKAVVSFAGVEKVFVVAEGVAHERHVRTGRELRDLIEIEDGLNAGEAVVLVPGDLVDGRKVSVTTEKH